MMFKFDFFVKEGYDNDNLKGYLIKITIRLFII